LEALAAQDRELLKALVREALEQVLQGEMTAFLGAGPGERAEGQSGCRAGYIGGGLQEKNIHVRLAPRIR